MAHPRSLAAPSVVLLTLVCATPGVSQSISSPYRHIEHGQEAGVIVGYMDAPQGRFGLGPKGAPIFGGSYSIALGGLVALEGMAFVMPTERDVVNPRTVEGNPVLPDPAEALLVNITGRLRFNLTGRRTWNGLQPYLTVGAGLVWDAEGAQVEDEPLELDERFSFGTQFAGAFGGGVRAILTDRLGLRAEYGVNLFQLDTPDGWRDPALGLGDSPESEWVNAPTFTVGVSYLF